MISDTIRNTQRCGNICCTPLRFDALEETDVVSELVDNGAKDILRRDPLLPGRNGKLEWRCKTLIKKGKMACAKGVQLR